MVYPDYIPTREVRLDRSFILESGSPLRIDYDLKASRSLLWAATGEPFPSITAIGRGAATGLPQTLTIPPTDLDGAWRDLDTNALIGAGAGEHTHSYTLTAAFIDAAGHVRKRVKLGPFSVPSGEEPVSIFDLLPLTTSEGEPILPPAGWEEIISEAISTTTAMAQDASAAAGQAAASAADASSSAAAALEARDELVGTVDVLTPLITEAMEMLAEARMTVQAAEFLFVDRGMVSGNVGLWSITTNAYVHMTLTGNVTLTLPTEPIPGRILTLVIAQDATGGHTVTIPDALAAYGVLPVPAADPNAVSEWHVVFDGVDWKVRVAGSNDLVPVEWEV